MGTFDSLKYRDFRLLWIGSFVSFLGENMQMITRGWLVLRLTKDSPFALSLVMVAYATPLTFMSLIGGALADRIPRKSMILSCQAANVVISLLLATLDFTGLIQFWHLLAIAAINGCLLSLYMPSRQAIVSDVVPVQSLMNAISLNSSGFNLSRVLGPAIAGVLIIYLDTAGVFYLIAGMYIFAVLSMTMVRSGSSPSSSRKKGMWGDIREGLSYTARSPTLLSLMIMTFLPTLFGFSYITFLPAWAREVLDVRSDGLGLLMTAMGLGSLSGALLLASAGNFSKRGKWLLINSMAWGVGMALFSQMESYATSMLFLFMIGFLNSIFMSLSMTLMQTYSSPEMRGRVMSLGIMTFGVTPLSALPFGAIAEKIGTPNTLSISGLMLVVFTILFLLLYPGARNID